MMRIKIAAIVALALLGACAPKSMRLAQAQTVMTFVPLGYCQLTSLAAATKLSACSGGIPAGATSALISVEGAAIRYRDDGTAPTTTVGMPIAIGQAFQ